MKVLLMPLVGLAISAVLMVTAIQLCRTLVKEFLEFIAEVWYSEEHSH